MSITLLVFIAFFAMMAARSGRRRPPHDLFESDGTRRELEDLRRAVEDLSSRFHRLETERDFYRDLLGPGAPPGTAARSRTTGPGGDPAEDAGRPDGPLV